MTTRPFEPDFANDQYPRSYLSLYQGLGKLGGDCAPNITLEEYKNGYTLWCVDFTKDQEAQQEKFHLIELENRSTIFQQLSSHFKLCGLC